MWVRDSPFIKGGIRRRIFQRGNLWVKDSYERGESEEKT